MAHRTRFSTISPANMITMQGNAQIKNVQGEFSGSQLVYDLDSQNLVGDGNVRLLIEPATGAARH